MPHIQVISYEESSGKLRSIYDHLISTRGKLADVHTIQSLNPATIESHMRLYQDIMFGQSPLRRYQREMLGVVVSAANSCRYCVQHHREALLHYWKNEARVNALEAMAPDANLTRAEQLLCLFARDATLDPSASSAEKIAALKNAGFDDRCILDATLVISYFNFVNRIVLALGLDVTETETKGYQY